jgi:hypothetical protein
MFAGMASKSFAIEPGSFTNYLRGATQGLPLGALPEPGLYGGFATSVTGLGSSPGKGDSATPFASNQSFSFGESLLWVPGWTFLGASYGASIVQGEYFGTFASPVDPPFTTSGIRGPELANTTFTPVALSWNLTHGWFFALGLNVIAPDGSQWHSTATDTNLNPDFWTISPAWAISYLDASWLLSANFRYDVNFASRGVTMGEPLIGAAAARGYTSGNELFGDLAALYKLGRWEIGPVGYFRGQTTADRPGDGIKCTPSICGYQSQVAVGGLVGYDFGPVSVQTWFDQTVECRNAICGLDVWARMNFKIWGAETAKPLAAKN